jgi:membrane-bound lytic murein transglycosylase D
MTPRFLLLPVFAVSLSAQDPATPTAPAPAAPAETDDLFSLGQALFDAYAPPEIKKNYAFPTREQWDAFAARLEKTRETGTLAELAAYEPEARTALLALRALPDYADYADWLEERIDEIVVAKKATQPVAPPPPPDQIPPPPPPDSLNTEIPLYDLWVTRTRERPRPARADEFLPDLKKIFTAEGLPADLVWLVETESMFNPQAKSPAGARGLFQFMPVTAKAQGLSLFPFDERTHPEKSALAAATLLRRLHDMFGSWPLALAAYNAGEGRVRRTLKAQNAQTFAQIADALPTETRLYVPKVLATLAVREGIDASSLPAPKSK